MSILTTILASIPAAVITTLAIWAFLKPTILRAIGTAVDKAITHQYDLKLEDYRLSNNSQIERIRAEHALSNIRVSEIAKREADYTLEAWGLLRVAFAEVADVVSPSQQYEDISKLSDEDARVSMELHGLSSPQIGAVLSSSDRFKLYRRYLDRIRNSEAHDHGVTFNQYLMKHQIFMPSNMVGEFEKAAKPMWAALRAHSNMLEFPSERSNLEWEKRSVFVKEYVNILQGLLDTLRANLLRP